MAYRLSEHEKETIRQKWTAWNTAIDTAQYTCKDCGRRVPYSTMTSIPDGAEVMVCIHCEYQIRLRQATTDEESARFMAMYEYLREVALEWLEREFPLPKKDRCPKCGGRGTVAQSDGKKIKIVDCDRCGGTGEHRPQTFNQ